jgi:hypothetical protein
MEEAGRGGMEGPGGGGGGGIPLMGVFIRAPNVCCEGRNVLLPLVFRPFSGISRTIPDTQLDNLPNHTGQRSPAGIIL